MPTDNVTLEILALVKDLHHDQMVDFETAVVMFVLILISVGLTGLLHNGRS